jgi:hypothetical protein
MNAGAFCFSVCSRDQLSPVALEENVKESIRNAALAVIYMVKAER